MLLCTNFLVAYNQTTWRNRLREKFKNMRKRGKGKRSLECEESDSVPPVKKTRRDFVQELELLKKEMPA